MPQTGSAAIPKHQPDQQGLDRESPAGPPAVAPLAWEAEADYPASATRLSGPPVPTHAPYAIGVPAGSPQGKSADTDRGAGAGREAHGALGPSTKGCRRLILPWQPPLPITLGILRGPAA